MNMVLIATIIFIAILLGLGLFFTRLGNLSFWKLASQLPNEFMEHVADNDVWIISESDLSKPGDEYVGPFKFTADGVLYTLYAKDEFLENSQEEFLLKYREKIPKKSFPIISFLSLAYPIAAIMSYKEATSLTALLGYGFCNLGYLLVVAFIFGGSFRVLGFENRVNTIVAAVIFWVVGVVLTNV